MITVYDLRRDHKWIASVQKATLTTQKFGIEQTHGLFGSDEWWAKIDSGTLPVITIRGSISRIYMGSMNDWPEFEMTSQEGNKSSWSRYANSPELGKFYVKDHAIEIDYVLQRHRQESFDHGCETKCVLAIRIGDLAKS